MEYRKKFGLSSFIKSTISVPFIWSLIVPLITLDVWTEIYHRICFPLYGLPYVNRARHIKIDRHKLDYLNPFEKLCCAYCGYANGLTHYWAEIAARTEYFWCGIMHEPDKDFIVPTHQYAFVEYGDEEGLIREFGKDPLKRLIGKLKK